MRYQEFNDFDAFAESIRDVDARMILRNVKRHNWTSFSVDFGSVEVQFGRLGSGNLAQAELRQDGYFLYLPLTRGVDYVANGIVVADKSFVIVEPGSEFCISTKEPHDWCAAFLRTDWFPDLGALHAHSSSCWVTRPNRKAADLFQRIVRQVMQTATTCPDFEATDAAFTAAGEILQATKLALDLREISEADCKRRPKIPRQQIIRKCMEFLEEHAGCRVVVADLATAAGVSERTLRSAFNEYFGVGPIRYLYLRRLNQIRRALCVAEPDGTTVAKVLAEHGEWSFGRFASSYHQLFGELPSETMRKKLARRQLAIPNDAASLNCDSVSG